MVWVSQGAKNSSSAPTGRIYHSIQLVKGILPAYPAGPHVGSQALFVIATGWQDDFHHGDTGAPCHALHQLLAETARAHG